MGPITSRQEDLLLKLSVQSSCRIRVRLFSRITGLSYDITKRGSNRKCYPTSPVIHAILFSLLHVHVSMYCDQVYWNIYAVSPNKHNMMSEVNIGSALWCIFSLLFWMSQWNEEPYTAKCNHPPESVCADQYSFSG